MIPGIIAQTMRLVGAGPGPSALNAYLLYGWGWDFYKEMMGKGAEINPSDDALDSPVQLHLDKWHMVSGGQEFAIGIKADGTLWGWGRNTSGQLGLGEGSSSGPHDIPQQIGTSNDWKYVSCGTEQVLAINTAGDMYAWGLEAHGERGLGIDANSWAYDIFVPTLVTETGTNIFNTDDPPSRIPGTGISSGPWKQVACGSFHTIALKEDGTIWATGLIAAGQTGTTLDGYGPDLVEFTQIGTDADWSFVNAGWDTSFGIKTNGTLWGWGFGEAGAIGNGGNVNVYQPVQIGTMVWKTVSAGAHFTLGITTDGKLWAWGDNYYYQLGADGPSVNVPTQVGTDTDWDFAVASGRQMIAEGDPAGFAVKTDGSLYSWGFNRYTGQLGRGLGFALDTPVSIGQVAGTQWKLVGTGWGTVFALRDDG